jgi:outer membrane receptor protein involved in Fe transport
MGALYVDSQIRWNRWLRARAGLRADAFDVDVTSDNAANSGSAHDTLLSPKLNLVFGPWAKTELYVNLGYGFHSNDARGATIRVDPRTGDPVGRVDPLVRAKGVDLGLRTTALAGLQSTVTLFLLELDSELVFVGDAGGTEASRPSRRHGVELANFYRPRDWLTLDVDLALTSAEFTDSDLSGDHIPGAIERAVAAGVTLGRPVGYFGSLRWRYLGPRPLIEDDSVRSDSISLVNARVGFHSKGAWSVALEVFNVFDSEASDIEYFYASRLPGEPAGGVEDVHFHPMESRTVRVSADWRF